MKAKHLPVKIKELLPQVRQVKIAKPLGVVRSQEINNPSFVVRKRIDEGSKNVSAPLICSERPNVVLVEDTLNKIFTAAPQEIKEDLSKLSKLSTELDSDTFYTQYRNIKHRIEKKKWQPLESLTQTLKHQHLTSNGKVSEQQNWIDIFGQQVQEIRYCHLRSIAKKGHDLHGYKHFSFCLEQDPKISDVSARGRTKCAKEVLDEGEISQQAKQLLIQSLNRIRADNSMKIELYCARPVKDYNNREHNYNFLTASYAYLLRERMQGHSNKICNGLVEIKDYPVMMLTATSRTDTTPVGRIVKQPYFVIEDDIRGKNVLIIDDHINAGGFFATINSQLTEKGANVTGVAAFSRHPNSSNLLIDKEVKDALTLLYKEKEINGILQTVGLSVDTLTNREGLTLLAIMMDGNNPEYVRKFDAVEKKINGCHSNLIEGINDDLRDELKRQPITLIGLKAQVDEMLKDPKARSFAEKVGRPNLQPTTLAR